MKRGALLILLLVISVLSVSLVSANWFTDLFKKPQLSPTEISLTNQLFGAWSTAVTWLDVMKADVNGDGLDDVIGRESANGNWWVGVSDGTKFNNKLFGKWNPNLTRSDMMVADVNNDGKDDVIGRIYSGDWYAGVSDGVKFVNTYVPNWTFKARDPMKGDINGDGYIDKVQLDSDGEWWVMYSDSAGTLQPAVKIGAWSTAVTWNDVQVTDVNGDGKDDVIGRTNSGQWWAGISTKQIEPTCTDSDGRDQFVAGYVEAAEKETPSLKQKHYDVCTDTDSKGGEVLEYLCGEDRYLSKEYIKCSAGCSSGACISTNQTITCTDSDGGINLYQKGEIKYFYDVPANEFYGWHTTEDVCNSDGTLTEFACELYNSTELHPSKKYDCQNGCSNGACLKEAFTELDSLIGCPQIENFIKTPTSFILNENKWRLGYNSSWISGSDSRKSYYASFDSIESSNYGYLSINMQEVDEGFEEELLQELKSSLEWNLCSETKINEQDVYICLNPWDVAWNTREINNIDNSISKMVVWISGNKLFEIYSYTTNNYWDCWDQESCEARENYIHRRQQENLIDAFEKITNNEREYIGGFYLDWRAEQVVRKLVENCKSDLDFGEDVCYSGWNCKVEPVICPPHGTQTQTCTQWCNDEQKKVTTEIDCSPGICAGCYVPKWFGDEWGNNKCIPYGFRFEHQTGWKIEDVFVEYGDTEGLTVEEADKSEGEVELVVYPDNTALLNLEIKQGGYKNISLEIGKEYDWDELIGDPENKIQYTLYVDDIYFNSEDYKQSYIQVTFKAQGWEQRQVADSFNAYCDIDGKIKQQTTDWQACQNSYECESNLCSGQECTGINQMIKETATYKVIGIKIICRILHLLSNENYLQCQANLLAGQAPESAQ